MECQVFGHPVHYETYGEGIPLIMLHGRPIDGAVMAARMEPLFARRQGWQRVYIDMPGMGQTPAHENIKDMDGLLETVLEFIRQVVRDQRFALAGWSFGGYVARGVLQRKAKMVAGLLLIVPTIFRGDRRTTPPAHVTLVHDPALASQLEPSERQDFESVVVVQSREAWALLKQIREAAEHADQEFLSRLSEDFSSDPDDLTKPFNGPSLFIAGRQDSRAGYADIWRLYQNYSRCTLAVLDRAGHGLIAEQALLFEALVQEWLDRVEESRRSALP